MFVHMIHAKSIGAVALKVADLAKSQAWYRNRFGFEYRYDVEGGVVVGRGCVEIVLSPTHDPSLPLATAQNSRCIHTFGFEVSEEDLQEARKAFAGEHVAFEQDTFKSIVVNDPDGYCVELFVDRPRRGYAGQAARGH
jgi:catechol-2,3-dioxygenase